MLVNCTAQTILVDMGYADNTKPKKTSRLMLLISMVHMQVFDPAHVV